MQYFCVLSQGCYLPFTMQDFHNVLNLNIRAASSKADTHFYCMLLCTVLHVSIQFTLEI